MKRMISRLIALSLAAVLVVTMSGAVFADAGHVTVDPQQPRLPDIGYEEELMTATVMENTSTSVRFSSYTNSGTDSCIVVPVRAPETGIMWLEAKNCSSSSAEASVYMTDNYDVDSSGYVIWGDYTYDYVEGLAPGQSYSNSDGNGMPVVKGTTYYIVVTNDSYEGVAKVGLAARIYRTGQNRKLPAYADGSRYMLLSGVNQAGDSTSDTYIKVQPSRTGLMTVTLKAYGTSPTTGKVTLYNSSKKRISDYQISYNSAKSYGKAYFGVKSGKTYYLRIQDCCGSYDNGFRYGIRYGVAAYKDKSINKKSKAIKLKRKGTGSGTLFAATNATGVDYYKIHVSKTRTTKFSIDTSKIKSGNVKVRVYKNGKQIGKTKTIYPNAEKTVYALNYGTKSGKASAGTYYIKLTKSEKASGLYRIRYIQ